MTAADFTIGFIGGGNMARAIVSGLVQGGHAPEKIHVADPDEVQRARIVGVHRDIAVTTDNAEVVAASNLLLLAVKPQVMGDVVQPLKSLPHPVGQVVVSIAAGLNIARFADWLGANREIVRIMPNQPMLVGAGMSGLVAGPGVSETNRERADYVASCAGKTVWLKEEADIDALTAVSGSGPAYFYLLTEILQHLAHEYGFGSDEARLLATETALGAARVLVEHPELTPAEARKQVTSPGGTTEAALKVMEEAGIRDILRDALDAARARSAELGKG